MAKKFTSKCTVKDFVINKVENTVPWTYVIEDLHTEKKCWNILLKELQKANQTEFRVEKVIKRKNDILYKKWKGYDNSFN